MLELLKKAFCKMCVTICGRFVRMKARSGYGNWIRAKYTAKWGVQIAGMIFQTRSGTPKLLDLCNRIHRQVSGIFISKTMYQIQKSLQKYLQGGIDRLHLIDKWMSDFLYKKLWNGSPSQSSDTTFIHTKINCTIIFFHPDCTVGPGISPDHTSRLAAYRR